MAGFFIGAVQVMRERKLRKLRQQFGVWRGERRPKKPCFSSLFLRERVGSLAVPPYLHYTKNVTFTVTFLLPIQLVLGLLNLLSHLGQQLGALVVGMVDDTGHLVAIMPV
jgi:hypothetical protein